MGLVCVIIVAIGLFTPGCNEKEEPDEYYVKYAVSSNTIYSQLTLYTTVNNENNVDLNYTFYAGAPWEKIIGPVQKGFNATLEVSCVDAELLIGLEIYVSKNDSPFAIKASDSNGQYRKSAQLGYTIDY
jgi:hypothetical protein